MVGGVLVVGFVVVCVGFVVFGSVLVVGFVLLTKNSSRTLPDPKLT